MNLAQTRGSVERLRPIAKPLGAELRRAVGSGEFHGFGDALGRAWGALAPRLSLDAEKRAALDAEVARGVDASSGIQLARTAPFWDNAERKQAGSGGLLSITVNPEACKGCNLCVEVCPDGALESVKQDDSIVATLRERWAFWQKLPDTPQRFVNVSNIEEGIGVLPTLLLRKHSYRSMAGGDGACMGCGEKTAVHLIVSTIEAMMRPRVERYVAELDELIASLDAKARTLMASDAELETMPASHDGTIEVPLASEKRRELERLRSTLHDLKTLRWRYVEGPSGLGRASMAMANSTGCSSVWASTFPYNPYPFPWANHLFQDSPSLAIGVFEGHMRKMADGFAQVRRARALLADEYDAETTERELGELDWKTFTDDEFAMCPPIISMGGDGAMLDIGFQNLSRLMMSGKPIRVIVLDTQVYSNTGGQACTSGFTGQVSDMAWYGSKQHGKTEVRKELALIALAHRGVYVHQSSQASASHLMAGVLKGLQKRRPALFNVYTPCPVEHGLADDVAQHAARLALESRAFPYVTFDPDAGRTWAECLSLDGNPSVDDDWPTYTLEYVDETGGAQSMELPLTIADWAATEGRFRKHFKPIDAKSGIDADSLTAFHEYLALSAEERDGRTPFIHVLGEGKRLARWSVSGEIVRLAEERQQHWAQLRELAGVVVAEPTRERVRDALEAELEAKLDAARQDYEAKLADVRATYPAVVARRLAEGVLKASKGGQTVRDLLVGISADTTVPVPLQGSTPNVVSSGELGVTATTAAPEKASAAAPAAPAVPQAVTPHSPLPTQSPVEASAAAPAPAAASASAAAPESIAIEPYIDSERCTTCNECINLNKKLFAYNANKQAYVKDPKAGTFAQLVQAAEKCPVSAIHPGTPLNPKEKDLEKWLKRAQAF
jgi:pyruvate-ferredoxin/flavodoxin oxidoreductase